MKLAVYIVLGMISYLVHASDLKSGYYLKWDTDHTERKIRPVYPISTEKIGLYNTYYIEVEDQKPQSVCYFTSSRPSNKSDFGSHCIKFAYEKNSIYRTFVNIDGERISNNEGVYAVKYILDGQEYPTKKQNFGESNNLIEDKSGSAEYYFKRDELGRRYSEVRKNANGDVVLEHNGFYEARFIFDANDYAAYRRGFDRDGNIMEGKYGYATAHFWFDENGNFEKEEFRNSSGKLVLGPSNRFARIEYKNIDSFGNWHEVNLYDASGELLKDSPAILLARYHRNARRESISYYDSKMNPSENAQGINKYLYIYDKVGHLIERKGYSLKDELVE
ncbi:hypothetical protein [Microbulbifer sp. TYP-18]|uniref:hypothetical protein n=1 Tax=Microbulbifer sp. TYP-18 TaxID=3230024 RepID=UPI0034C5EEA9